MSFLLHNRYYKSTPIVDPYDLRIHHDYLIFDRKDTVRIGSLNKGNIFKEFGNGRYKVEGNYIFFSLIRTASLHESTWRGTISANYIDFGINNPDFEEVDGRYELVN